MAYKSGEEGLETLIEVPYPPDPVITDSRIIENFSSSNYKKAGKDWDQPYVAYDSKYKYIEGFSKYRKAGEIFLCKKGTRPALTWRGGVTSGSGILSKKDDGKVIFTSSDGSTEIEIFPASLDVKWFIMDLVGGGGGGAGHTGSYSGGGGGGGGYALCLLQFRYTNSTWEIVLGNKGSGGSGYQSGGNGNNSYLKKSDAYTTTVLTCTGGEGGTVGKTSLGGDSGSASLNGTHIKSTLSDLTQNSYGYCIKRVNGGWGGDKGNPGGKVEYSCTIPSPENTKIENTVAGGDGTPKYGGGGGASAVAPGGRGGIITLVTADRNGVDGQYGSGGGGASWSGSTEHGGKGGNGYASFYY